MSRNKKLPRSHLREEITRLERLIGVLVMRHGERAFISRKDYENLEGMQLIICGTDDGVRIEVDAPNKIIRPGGVTLEKGR